MTGGFSMPLGMTGDIGGPAFDLDGQLVEEGYSGGMSTNYPINQDENQLRANIDYQNRLHEHLYHYEDASTISGAKAK